MGGHTNGLSLLPPPDALFFFYHPPWRRWGTAAVVEHRLWLFEFMQPMKRTFGGWNNWPSTPRGAANTSHCGDADRYIEFHEVPRRYVHIDRQAVRIHIYRQQGNDQHPRAPAQHHLLHTKSTFDLLWCCCCCIDSAQHHREEKMKGSWQWGELWIILPSCDQWASRKNYTKRRREKKREKKAKKWDETRRGVKQSQSSSTLSLEEDDILRLDLYTRRSRKKKKEKNTTHIMYVCMWLFIISTFFIHFCPLLIFAVIRAVNKNTQQKKKTTFHSVFLSLSGDR